MGDWITEVLSELPIVIQLVRSGSGSDPALADPSQIPDQAIRISGVGPMHPGYPDDSKTQAALRTSKLESVL